MNSTPGRLRRSAGYASIRDDCDQQRLFPLVKESENAFPAFGAMSRIQQRDEPEEKLNPSEFRETLKSTLEAQN
jgi:hypothetical protein